MRTVRQRLHAVVWILLVWLASREVVATNEQTTLTSTASASIVSPSPSAPAPALPAIQRQDEPELQQHGSEGIAPAVVVDLSSSTTPRDYVVPVPASILRRRGALGERASLVDSFRFKSPPFVNKSPSTTTTTTTTTNPSATAKEQRKGTEEEDDELSIEDMTLSPLVLVVTVDGHVHALNRNSGDWIWTLHDDEASSLSQGTAGGKKEVPFGSPLVSTRNVRRNRSSGGFLPSSRRANSSKFNPDPNPNPNSNMNEKVKGKDAGASSTSFPQQQQQQQPEDSRDETSRNRSTSSSTKGNGFNKEEEEEIYVIEPTAGGQIYLYERNHDSGDEPRLEKLPLSMQELVALSPFTFPSESSRMFMGGSDSKIVAVDIRTGRLVGVFGSGGAAWCEWDPAKAGVRPDQDCEDDISRRPQDLLYMGRTEYTLSIYAKTSSVPLQTLTYTTYTSSALGIALQAQWTHTPDSLYLQPMHDGSLVCFKAGEPGIKWSVAFDAPAVSVFDIALPPAPTAAATTPSQFGTRGGHGGAGEHDAPLLFEQPHPLVVDGLPLDFKGWQQLPDTTFVGRVGDSLFAMSRDRYPLTTLSPWGRKSSSSSSLDASEESSSRADCQGLDCLIGRYVVSESFIAPIGTDSSIDPPSSRLLIDGPRSTSSASRPSSSPSSSSNAAVPSVPGGGSISTPSTNPLRTFHRISYTSPNYPTNFDRSLFANRHRRFRSPSIPTSPRSVSVDPCP